MITINMVTLGFYIIQQIFSDDGSDGDEHSGDADCTTFLRNNDGDGNR
jgi:hypothetical protein